MTGIASAAQLAAATAYEEKQVPALMGEWAPRMVEAAAMRRGHRVLDVACGTGVLSKAAAKAVGDGGEVTGLDADAGMLQVAARGAPGITWRQGFAEELPFADHSFDAVVSQFGLMFFRDRTAGLRQMWRVLRSGGRMAVAVWASLEETPAYAAEVALVERLAGGRVAEILRYPFNLGDRARFAREFAAAGIPLESVATHQGTGRFPSVRGMLEADLLDWLPLAGIKLDRETVARILSEGEEIFRPYVAADGSVAFASPAHIAIAGN